MSVVYVQMSRQRLYPLVGHVMQLMHGNQENLEEHILRLILHDQIAQLCRKEKK